MDNNYKLIFKLLKLFYRQNKKYAKLQKEEQIKQFKKEIREIKKFIKEQEKIRDRYYREKAKADTALRQKFENARIRPSHRSELMNRLTAIDITYADDPKKAKLAKQRAFNKLLDLSDEIKERLLTTNASSTEIERKTWTMSATEATKFGKSLKFKAKKYMQEYGPNWRVKYAEDVIGGVVKGVKESEIKKAHEYKIWEKIYGTPKKDKHYYRVLYGTKKLIADSQVLKDLNTIIKESPRESKSYWVKLREDYKKTNKITVADYMMLRESSSLKDFERSERLLEKASWSTIDKWIQRDLPISKSEKIKSKTKKLFAGQDGVNLAYAIGKGRARGSYDELFKYIEDFDEFIFHPNNRDALAESQLFRERLAKRFGDTKGMKWVNELLEKFKTDEVIYKPVDTSINIEEERKEIRRQKMTTSVDINNLIPVTEQQKAARSMILEKTQKHLQKKEIKKLRAIKAKQVAQEKREKARRRAQAKHYDKIQEQKRKAKAKLKAKKKKK